MREAPTRILLVEDNPADVRLVREALKGQAESFELSVAKRVSEAIEAVLKRPDVILLDLDLPDAAGISNVERMREAAPDVPIVVLTGANGEALALQCLEAGAHDYLGKSELQPIVLRRTLSFALERQRQAELRDLQDALDHYRALSSQGVSTSVTRTLAGVEPVRVRVPEAFATVQQSYRGLLHGYLNHLAGHEPKPLASMEKLAGQLGELRGGARDLIDMHIAGLDAATQGSSGEQSEAYGIEGRLLALEMMGHLVDYYRLRIPSGRATEAGR